MYDNIERIISTSNYICSFNCVAFKLKDTLALQQSEVSFFHDKQSLKFDLENNFTFIIPVKIDNEFRRNNLTTVINFIDKYFKNYSLIVSEQDTNSKIDFVDKNQLIFNKQKNSFHKTKAMNDATKRIQTEFGCIFDCDYIVSPLSFYHCFNKLKEGFDFAHPSVGLNLYLNQAHTMTFMKHHKLPCHIDVNYHRFFDPAHYPGLCFMFNTKSYFNVGLENETFVTWGFEDHERFIRIEKLEKNTYYSPSCGYHLWHPRNSDFYDQVWFENDQIVSEFKKQDNLDELKRIFDFNKDELESEILTWHWIK